MTEEEAKILCRLMVEDMKPLTHFQKELIKQAIDRAKTPMEMIVAIVTIFSQNQK